MNVGDVLGGIAILLCILAVLYMIWDGWLQKWACEECGKVWRGHIISGTVWEWSTAAWGRAAFGRRSVTHNTIDHLESKILRGE